MGPVRTDGRGRWVGAAFVLVLLLALALAAGQRLTRAQDATPAGEERGDAAVRVIHGSSDAGAFDVYVDGAVALSAVEFPSASDYLFLAAGDHQVQVVAAGATPDQAVIDATLTFEAGQAYAVAALGSVADLQAVVYEVDLGPLADGRARLRVVHGSPDVGPIDVAVTGGDLLFPTVAYPNETEYADLDAGSYDLEARSAGTEEAALALPGTVLEAGVVYDLFAVGQLADGTLQPLVVTSAPEVAQVGGRPAHVHSGGCGARGPADIVAALTNLTEPEGERLGHADAATTESSFTNVPVALDRLLAADHVVDVHLSEEEIGTVVACGEIGGTPTENGTLVVGLREQNGSGLTGIAFLFPSVTDPATTDVSVSIARDLAAPAGGEVGAGPAADLTVPAEATVETGATPGPTRAPDDAVSGDATGSGVSAEATEVVELTPIVVETVDPGVAADETPAATP